MTAIAELPIHLRPQVEYRCPKCRSTSLQAAGVTVYCHDRHGRPDMLTKMRQGPLSQATLDSLQSR